MGRKGANPRRANGSRRDKARARLRAQGLPCHLCGLPIGPTPSHLDPLAWECDELVPVSRGGSPCDPANLAPAHRCCNSWRGDLPMAEAGRLRSLALERFGPWPDPLAFVAEMKAVQRGGPDPRAMRCPKTSTDW